MLYKKIKFKFKFSNKVEIFKKNQDKKIKYWKKGKIFKKNAFKNVSGNVEISEKSRFLKYFQRKAKIKKM